MGASECRLGREATPEDEPALLDRDLGHLGVLPSRKPAGRWAYCVDERGELRRIPWAHRDDPCLLGGEVVARLGGR